MNTNVPGDHAIVHADPRLVTLAPEFCLNYAFPKRKTWSPETAHPSKGGAAKRQTYGRLARVAAPPNDSLNGSMPKYGQGYDGGSMSLSSLTEFSTPIDQGWVVESFTHQSTTFKLITSARQDGLGRVTYDAVVVQMIGQPGMEPTGALTRWDGRGFDSRPAARGAAVRQLRRLGIGLLPNGARPRAGTRRDGET